MSWRIKQPVPVVRETLYLKGAGWGEEMSSSALYNPLGRKGEAGTAQTQSQGDRGTKEHIPVLSAIPLKQPRLSTSKEGRAKATESSANKATQKG